MLGFIKRISYDFNNVEALKAIYFAHVRSHLEYASVVWSPFYQHHSNRIESIQKKIVLFALRRVYPLHLYNQLPSYTFRCDILKLHSLTLRRNLAGVIFVHDVLSNKIQSIFILSKLHFVVPSRTLRRNNNIFKIPFVRTNFELNDPIIAVCSLCNRINNHPQAQLEFCLNRNTFKKIITELLLLN